VMGKREDDGEPKEARQKEDTSVTEVKRCGLGTLESRDTRREGVAHFFSGKKGVALLVRECSCGRREGQRRQWGDEEQHSTGSEMKGKEEGSMRAEQAS
ncbi:hypothetical protein, partial [Thermogemmatispora sp.]|uniref:hypothetical protein n=1 Tax=Thermogemmatispora sp. TaxID=1968838 RepID=UPI002ACBFFCA